LWDFAVAPLAGAWIEIALQTAHHLDGLVAPLAGAWIEIPLFYTGGRGMSSRSPRGSVD